MFPPPILYRFSSLARLTSFVDEGKISFNHARNFTAGELTPGQRDNEQERLYVPDVRRLQLDVESAGRGRTPIQNLTNVSITLNLPDVHGNPLAYYLLCCSTDRNDRMFGEFKADAVVTIKDPTEFFRRLEAATQAQMPDFGCHGKSVQYFPRNSVPTGQKTWEYIFFKDDVFGYQDEFRFVLIGPPNLSTEDRKELVLGPLNDICVVEVRP